MKQRIATVLVAVLLVSSAVVGVAAAAGKQPIDDPNRINHSSAAVQSAAIPVTLSKDVHEVGWSPIEYENDNGNLDTLDAHVNATDANPVAYSATHIAVKEFREFPRKSESDNSASALDASEWTTTVSDTGTGDGDAATSLSVTDTTISGSVPAVQVATGGSMGSGDTATATYGNFSITEDELKRELQLAAAVSNVEAATHVEIRVVDEDGDYIPVVIDPDNATDAAKVLANGTGESFVLQQQLGDLSVVTVSGSDSTFDNIEKIEVVTSDGDFSGTFTLINAEKMGRYAFGEQAYDGSDDNDEKDQRRTLYEPIGRVHVTGYDALGAAFSNATVHDSTVNVLFATSDLEKAMDAHIEFTTASDYPDFKYITDVYYRLKLPSAYDLSYSGASLRATVELPASRYQSVEVAEGVGDTPFADITGWTGMAGSFDTQGEQVTLDSTIQPGQQIALHFEYVITSGDAATMVVSSFGGAGQFAQDSGGGIMGFLTSLPGIGAIIALLGGIKLFGG